MDYCGAGEGSAAWLGRGYLVAGAPAAHPGGCTAVSTEAPGGAGPAVGTGLPPSCGGGAPPEVLAVPRAMRVTRVRVNATLTLGRGSRTVPDALCLQGLGLHCIKAQQGVGPTRGSRAQRRFCGLAGARAAARQLSARQCAGVPGCLQGAIKRACSLGQVGRQASESLTLPPRRQGQGPRLSSGGGWRPGRGPRPAPPAAPP